MSKTLQGHRTELNKRDRSSYSYGHETFRTDSHWLWEHASKLPGGSTLQWGDVIGA